MWTVVLLAVLLLVATLALRRWMGGRGDEATIKQHFAGKVVWITGASSGLGEGDIFSF